MKVSRKIGYQLSYGPTSIYLIIFLYQKNYSKQKVLMIIPITLSGVQVNCNWQEYQLQVDSMYRQHIAHVHVDINYKWLFLNLYILIKCKDFNYVNTFNEIVSFNFGKVDTKFKGNLQRIKVIDGSYDLILGISTYYIQRGIIYVFMTSYMTSYLYMPGASVHLSFQ